MDPPAPEMVLYGGTFNPIHLGHLIIAEECRRRLGAARVLFLPAAQPPHKNDDIAPAEHRLEMVRLAAAANPGFEVSDLEIARGGRSYTIDTVRELQRLAPSKKLHLLVGADSVPDLPTWRDAKALLGACQVVTAARHGWDTTAFDGIRGFFGDAAVDALRRFAFDTPVVEISSTEIRRRLRAGERVRYWVPDAVEEYIRRHGLYGTGSATCP